MVFFNVLYTLMVIEVLLFRNAITCYRIIEYSYTDGSGDDDEQGDQEEDDAINDISPNSIENHTEQDTQGDSDLIDITKLNPGIKILDKNPKENSTVLPNYSRKLIGKSNFCESNRDCSGTKICNIYSRLCERCRYDGEICRKDSNCCNNRKCIWGRCKIVVYDGSENSPCQDNKNCQPNLCCAREHGQSVCKKYLQEGDTCEIPQGGLVFSIHHNCPCKSGLYCAQQSTDSRERKCAI